MVKTFEVRNYIIDKHGAVTFLVRMDLDTYNEALENFIAHLKNEYFDDGFRAGNYYPSEEELADMDNDRTSDDS